MVESIVSFLLTTKIIFLPSFVLVKAAMIWALSNDSNVVPVSYIATLFRVSPIAEWIVDVTLCFNTSFFIVLA